MNLSLLILLPLLTAVTILFCNGLKQVRSVALAGSVLQVALGIFTGGILAGKKYR